MAKRGKRRKIESKYIVLIIIVLVALFIALFSFTIKDKRNLNPLEQSLKDVLVGVEKIISIPFNFIGETFKKFADMGDAYEENQALKKELQNYNLVNTQNEELKEDIKDLKEMLNLNTTLSDYDYLYGTIISRNVGHWFNTITIDKGSFSGIEEGMIVINQDGLMGSVIKTSNFSSTIKLITTDDNPLKISVVIKEGENKVFGTIRGYDTKENLLLVDIVTTGAEASVGSVVMTSGLSDMFPSGILVGNVVGSTTDEFGLTKILKVKTGVDFNDLRYVSILKRKDNKE